MTRRKDNPRPPDDRGQGRHPEKVVLRKNTHYTVTVRDAMGRVEWSMDGAQVMAPDGTNVLRLAIPSGPTIEVAFEAE